jgi:hypothetical protein
MPVISNSAALVIKFTLLVEPLYFANTDDYTLRLNHVLLIIYIIAVLLML